ncbi:hypothetical protein SAMN00790413_05259 [Deinococcus hopiensis KR-140]|uniref:Uncharacterized protein n=1 Tax=Deinococcus hopiensis KR-140 TaxID=695939 RepID=A0A1W1UUF5_9DEIO|nr:hypothetical protein SAMN00790413_05259 [Deinococcus hopiensis KR-140]
MEFCSICATVLEAEQVLFPLQAVNSSLAGIIRTNRLERQ